jgi:serine/threonine-protein kinase
MELRNLGRYTLVRRLEGSPSRSELFVAALPEEGGAERYVAKLLMPGSEETRATREACFEHEIRILGAVNHPCIPTLHEHGRHTGMPYMIIDRVDGVDLATLLGHHEHEPRALSKELVVYLMGQVVDALAHVHRIAQLEDDGTETHCEILHRDLCPANIYLSVEGDVMLGDWGSATSIWLDSEHDTPGAGHTAYKAPERVTGSGQATVQSDLFALAVVMWEMLKGQRCFWAESELKTMDAIVRFDISNSKTRVTGLSSKLSEVVRKNLDRDPARRYDSAFRILQRLAQSPEAQAAEQSRLELGALVRAAKAARDGKAS